MREMWWDGARLRTGGLVAAAVLCLGAAGATALEETESERDALKACERQVCEIVVKKDASGSDFACTLSKTWNKSKIQEGIEKKKLSWGFGNARCSIDVTLARSEILSALSKPEHAVEFKPQTVKCEIEREKEVTEVSVTLAPKITFKGGKADKAWINVQKVEGPAVVRGALWTAAQAEDYVGLFQGELIAEVNEFIGQKCPKAVAN